MGIGERWEECELSSVDSSILCVVFSYLADQEIRDLATKIYERVD